MYQGGYVMDYEYNDLVRHIVERLRVNGKVATDEDVKSVLEYENEFFNDVGDMDVIITHEEDMINYIKARHPEYSDNDIIKILTALDEFHEDVVESHYNKDKRI